MEAITETQRDTGMTIGQLARRAHVHIETVRYYERRGLLKKPPRSASNYRIYSEEAVRRILFIKRAQKLGFTLSVIKDLLLLRERPTSQCASAYAQFRLKIIENEKQIEMLQAQLTRLRSLVEQCEREDAGDRCVLLSSLEAADPFDTT